ncbi:hypothetical protein QX201_13712 [Fusarium graminearum]
MSRVPDSWSRTARVASVPEKGSLIKWRRRGICGRWNATHHSESCLDTRRITDDMIYSNKGRADY